MITKGSTEWRDVSERKKSCNKRKNINKTTLDEEYDGNSKDDIQ